MKHNSHSNHKVQLTSKEKSELFGEGVVTVILLLMLNLSIIILLNMFIANSEFFSTGVWKNTSTITIANTSLIQTWQKVLLGLMVIADVIVVYWRLIRRYHQMQMRHVIMELHYIAEGNFDHRVNFTVNTDLQKVIDSINSLVDSTVQAMEEERQIEQSKDELVTNVSHDIRTPLTSIIGYLGLLRSGAVKNKTDEQKYIEIAFVKANQMKSLADDLFEYTTVRQGNTKLAFAPIKIDSMLQQVAAGFELEAEQKNIKIDVNVLPEDLTVEVDPEKMGRVFNNLVANALKYGEGASEIVLSAKKISTNSVEIDIANNGAEIPPDALKRVFERFYRVETSRSVETGGTGLGLAITKWIIQLHHGQIDVTSDADWTRFKMVLPIKQQNEATGEE